MKIVLTYIVFIALAMGLGFASAYMFPVGEWHANLIKPSWNPPNWIFAPVWTMLYVLIGIAGAVTWRRAPKSKAMIIWFLQLILNGLWTAVFFGAHQIVLGVFVIGLLLVLILLFIRATFKPVPLAAWCFVPYGLWVAFATCLNIAFAMLN